ncbi:MAG: hypothetical protein U0574_06125 [Phycisphaerales bacterium]
MNNANTNDPLNRRAEAGGPTHDAWNRLVTVSVAGTAILEQQFNGLGWRTLNRSDTNANGSVDEERVTYDSCGQARHHFGADIDGNGAVDGADLGVVTGLWGKTVADATYRAEADLNRDGTIDGGDMGIVLNYRSALATGQLSDTAAGGPDNVIGWDGYVFNPPLRTTSFAAAPTSLPTGGGGRGTRSEAMEASTSTNSQLPHP